MARSRLLTAAAGLLASLLVSAIAFLVFDTLLLFLVVPFVPFLFRGSREEPPTHRCPTCGYRTRSPEFAYCPKDGTELVRESNEEYDTG